MVRVSVMRQAFPAASLGCGEECAQATGCQNGSVPVARDLSLQFLCHTGGCCILLLSVVGHTIAKTPSQQSISFHDRGSVAVPGYIDAVARKFFPCAAEELAFGAASPRNRRFPQGALLFRRSKVESRLCRST
jgi:hypothetical protein